MPKEEKKEVVDFDLPEPDPNAPKAKPRVHNASDSTCTACEG